MHDRLRALVTPDTAVTPAESAGQAPEDDGVVGEACCGFLRGVQDRALGVEFRLAAGRGPWPAPDYALLAGRWWDESGSFTAEYSTGLKVTVRGWGLRRVYELFLRNRLAWLEEKGADPVREKRAREQGVKSWVHAIEVERPEETEG